MLLGSFAAIGQKNIKRLMAYSSIGHMGYALVGLAAGNQTGVTGVMLYMAIYMVMTLGSFAAIGQRNIKRLMAYSSIGHMGYALVGLAAGNQTGVSGVMLYMVIYMVMTLGSFAIIMSMRRKDGTVVEEVNDLAGLSTTNPFMATVLTILMFSLAGIPPLAGFFAKYFVFVAAIEAKLYALAIIGVLASVVGAYYYLRVIKLMWFDEATGEFARVSGSLRLVFGLSGLFVLAYVIIGGPIGGAAELAAATLF
jgi:NADH-quinone oxidoreductase subunit N